MSEIIDKILLQERETLTYQKTGKEVLKCLMSPETPADNGQSVQLPNQCVWPVPPHSQWLCLRTAVKMQMGRGPESESESERQGPSHL